MGFLERRRDGEGPPGKPRGATGVGGCRRCLLSFASRLLMRPRFPRRTWRHRENPARWGLPRDYPPCGSIFGDKCTPVARPEFRWLRCVFNLRNVSHFQRSTRWVKWTNKRNASTPVGRLWWAGWGGGGWGGWGGYCPEYGTSRSEIR